MSYKRSIIEREGSYFIAARARDLVIREAKKGCTAQLSTEPVGLEPPYVPIQQYCTPGGQDPDVSMPAGPIRFTNLIRLRCLISSKHQLEWYRSERFLKSLGGVSHRIGFEIVGNRQGITIGFLLHEPDAKLLSVAFAGEFSACTVQAPTQRTLFERNLFFYDFFPASFYHHLQTKPEELHVSPYEAWIRALAQLPATTQGFVQILFQPAHHDWAQNVKVLTDLEYVGKTIPDPHSPYRTHQMPSGELKNMARELETKAHYDKPFYFAALRVGVSTARKSYDVWPLTTVASLFHRDGQTMQYLTEADYHGHLDPATVRTMLQSGITYRPGFLLNTSELAALVHPPPIAEFLEERIRIESLESLSLPHSLHSGLVIGKGWCAGRKQAVRIPDRIRRTATHLIGKSGTGKTTTIESMSMQNVKNGTGVAYIDPHGDSVKRLLDLIPKSKVASTIYLDFGDPDWVPLWNPLHEVPKQLAGRASDDLVNAMKSIVQSKAWGDRLETILRHGFYGLVHLGDATFLDLLMLFEESGKKESERKQSLIKRILEHVDNEASRIYWTRHHNKYRRDDFAPPLHKLSKLLTSDETVSLMLSQPDNRLNFHELIESDKILLMDLSNLGPDNRSILGCFLLTFLHNAALFRNRMRPGDRKPFSIYCDEAHKLTTDTLEDMLIECRKFGVHLTLAHQFLKQFNAKQRDALFSAGSTIIFNVDMDDANHLIKDLQGKVESKEISTLGRGQAIARINTDIVKIETPPPLPRRKVSYKEEIIRRSRERYCRPADAVRQYLRQKQKRAVYGYAGTGPFPLDMTELAKFAGPLNYDQFE